MDEPNSPTALGRSIDYCIRVRWEGTEENIAEIKCTLKFTLNNLAQELMIHVPELKEKHFTFLHAGIPVLPQLWHMIPAMKLQPIAYLKEGIYDFIRRPSDDFMATASFDFEDDKMSLHESEASLSTTISGNNYLSFRKGDTIIVKKGDYGEEWWFGHVQGQSHTGWFPQNRVLTDRYIFTENSMSMDSLSTNKV